MYCDCTDLDARQDKLFVLLDRWMCHDKISYSKKIVTIAHLIGLIIRNQICYCCCFNSEAY